MHQKTERSKSKQKVEAPDLGGSATTWAECRWLWSGSGPSCCTEPHWSPSPCSRQTCWASVDRYNLLNETFAQLGSETPVKNRKSRAPHRVRDIKDAPNVERCVGAVVERVAGLVVGLGDVAVELLVLPVTDLLRLHHPQGLMRDEVKQR